MKLKLVERIVRTDIITTAFNREKLGDDMRARYWIVTRDIARNVTLTSGNFASREAAQKAANKINALTRPAGWTDWAVEEIDHNHNRGYLHRVVELACGHRVVTKALNRCRCPRCEEMLRRSITGEGEDYESFRHHDRPDRMEWPGDPNRSLNETGYD